MRLTLKLTPAATSMTWNKDVGTTSGRFFLSNNNQVEWISFSGITNNGDGTYTYTGLTRGLSQTADPVTAGTGSTWLQNQECILVAMHDQLVDKTQATTFADTITFAKNANFSGTSTAWLTLKSLTTAQRNALTPNVGDKIINTTTGTEQTYYGGTWNDAGTSTTPNASTTVAGKVEIATQAEVDAGTQIGGTGAFLSVWPDTLAAAANVPNIHTKTQKTAPIYSDEYLIADSAASFWLKRVVQSDMPSALWWNGSDGALSISSGTTTLTFVSGYIEKNYTTLSITWWTLNFSTPSTNWGIAYIKVKWDCTITGGTIDISGMGWAWWAADVDWSDGKYIVYNTNIAAKGIKRTPGTGGTGINTMGQVFKWYCGAGGWGWGWSSAWAGGWFLFLEVGWKFTFSTPATMNANGANGVWSACGGGGGWSVVIKCYPANIASQTGTITVNGWAGVNWAGWSGGGGGWSYSSGWTGWIGWSAGAAGTTNSFGSGWAWGTNGGGGGGGAWFYVYN